MRKERSVPNFGSGTSRNWAKWWWICRECDVHRINDVNMNRNWRNCSHTDCLYRENPCKRLNIASNIDFIDGVQMGFSFCIFHIDILQIAWCRCCGGSNIHFIFRTCTFAHTCRHIDDILHLYIEPIESTISFVYLSIVWYICLARESDRNSSAAIL